MLSKRIIASLTIRDGRVVQSIGFSRFLPVGSPEVAVEFLNAWGADEILVLDISPDRRERGPDFGLIGRLSAKSTVPLTVGGGIGSVAMMRTLIQSGADKVAINTAALENPNIIAEAAAVFGNQCIVVSIDAKEKPDGGYGVHTRPGTDPVAFAAECAANGAGEILIRSVDRDGSKKGYDTTLVRMVADAVGVPVVAAGGCGHPEHAARAFEEGHADACAVGNMLHFTEESVNTMKAYLRKRVPVRIDTYASYEHAAFDEAGRVAKYPDPYLEKLRFEYIPEETI